MNERGYFSRWAPWVFAVILAAAVGIGAYNAGVSHTLAVAARASGTAPPWGPYIGFHPFGFAFPLFFLLFWFFVARFFFWGGPWRRRYYSPAGTIPPSFDEWHRRAHDQMASKNAGTAANSPHE